MRSQMSRFTMILLLLCGGSAMGAPAAPKLHDVKSWLLLLNNDLTSATVAQIAASQHDMVVVDFLPSQPHHANRDMAKIVAELQRKPDGGRRIVIAYLNVGQAEDYRTYWRKGWKVGNPDWILMNDPDGWAGNFPVAYWQPGWREIVTGLAAKIAQSGFDGAYLDWVGGFQEDTVQKAARRAKTDPAAAMADLVAATGRAARAINPDFRLIGQNAAPLLENPVYLAALDGVAHESIWFTWGGTALGDCPVPRTEAEAGSAAFRDSLPPACRKAYDADPSSAMRFAGEANLVPVLSAALAAGKVIFTVDYTTKDYNRDAVAKRSRELGFRPFMGSKHLKDVQQPAP
jgi:cysteinyl-tRNA synthetase, unknown class